MFMNSVKKAIAYCLIAHLSLGPVLASDIQSHLAESLNARPDIVAYAKRETEDIITNLGIPQSCRGPLGLLMGKFKQPEDLISTDEALRFQLITKQSYDALAPLSNLAKEIKDFRKYWEHFGLIPGYLQITFNQYHFYSKDWKVLYGQICNELKARLMPGPPQNGKQSDASDKLETKILEVAFYFFERIRELDHNLATHDVDKPKDWQDIELSIADFKKELGEKGNILWRAYNSIIADQHAQTQKNQAKSNKQTSAPSKSKQRSTLSESMEKLIFSCLDFQSAILEFQLTTQQGAANVQANKLNASLEALCSEKNIDIIERKIIGNFVSHDSEEIANHIFWICQPLHKLRAILPLYHLKTETKNALIQAVDDFLNSSEQKKENDKNTLEQHKDTLKQLFAYHDLDDYVARKDNQTIEKLEQNEATKKILALFQSTSEFWKTFDAAKSIIQVGNSVLEQLEQYGLTRKTSTDLKEQLKECLQQVNALKTDSMAWEPLNKQLDHWKNIRPILLHLEKLEKLYNDVVANIKKERSMDQFLHLISLRGKLELWHPSLHQTFRVPTMQMQTLLQSTKAKVKAVQVTTSSTRLGYHFALLRSSLWKQFKPQIVQAPYLFAWHEGEKQALPLLISPADHPTCQEFFETKIKTGLASLEAFNMDSLGIHFLLSLITFSSASISDLAVLETGDLIWTGCSRILNPAFAKIERKTSEKTEDVHEVLEHNWLYFFFLLQQDTPISKNVKKTVQKGLTPLTLFKWLQELKKHEDYLKDLIKTHQFDQSAKEYIPALTLSQYFGLSFCFNPKIMEKYLGFHKKLAQIINTPGATYQSVFQKIRPYLFKMYTAILKSAQEKTQKDEKNLYFVSTDAKLKRLQTQLQPLDTYIQATPSLAMINERLKELEQLKKSAKKKSDTTLDAQLATCQTHAAFFKTELQQSRKNGFLKLMALYNAITITQDIVSPPVYEDYVKDCPLKNSTIADGSKLPIISEWWEATHSLADVATFFVSKTKFNTLEYKRRIVEIVTSTFPKLLDVDPAELRKGRLAEQKSDYTTQIKAIEAIQKKSRSEINAQSPDTKAQFQKILDQPAEINSWHQVTLGTQKYQATLCQSEPAQTQSKTPYETSKTPHPDDVLAGVVFRTLFQGTPQTKLLQHIHTLQKSFVLIPESDTPLVNYQDKLDLITKFQLMAVADMLLNPALHTEKQHRVLSSLIKGAKLQGFDPGLLGSAGCIHGRFGKIFWEIRGGDKFVPSNHLWGHPLMHEPFTEETIEIFQQHNWSLFLLILASILKQTEMSFHGCFFKELFEDLQELEKVNTTWTPWMFLERRQPMVTWRYDNARKIASQRFYHALESPKLFCVAQGGVNTPYHERLPTGDVYQECIRKLSLKAKENDALPSMSVQDAAQYIIDRADLDDMSDAVRQAIFKLAANEFWDQALNAQHKSWKEPVTLAGIVANSKDDNSKRLAYLLYPVNHQAFASLHSHLSPTLSLKVVNISLTPWWITKISTFTDLTNLILAQCNGFENTDLSPLTRLTSLENLSFAGNQIPKISPVVKIVRHFKRLQAFDCSKNLILEANLRSWSKLTSLTNLNLSDNPLLEDPFQGKLTSLKPLNFKAENTLIPASAQTPNLSKYLAIPYELPHARQVTEVLDYCIDNPDTPEEQKIRAWCEIAHHFWDDGFAYIKNEDNEYRNSSWLQTLMDRGATLNAQLLAFIGMTHLFRYDLKPGHLSLHEKSEAKPELLKVLKLEDQKITVTDLSLITRQFHSLTQLELKATHLSQGYNTLELLTQLKKLRLTQNGITSNHLSFLKYLTKLTMLDFGVNHIVSSPDTEVFKLLTNLTWLSLESNIELGHVLFISYMNLKTLNISSTGVQYLPQTKSLEKLTISVNNKKLKESADEQKQSRATNGQKSLKIVEK